MWHRVPKVNNNSLVEFNSTYGSDPGHHRKLIRCSYHYANGLDVRFDLSSTSLNLPRSRYSPAEMGSTSRGAVRRHFVGSRQMAASQRHLVLCLLISSAATSFLNRQCDLRSISRNLKVYLASTGPPTLRRAEELRSTHTKILVLKLH